MGVTPLISFLAFLASGDKLGVPSPERTAGLFPPLDETAGLFPPLDETAGLFPPLEEAAGVFPPPLDITAGLCPPPPVSDDEQSSVLDACRFRRDDDVLNCLEYGFSSRDIGVRGDAAGDTGTAAAAAVFSRMQFERRTRVGPLSSSSASAFFPSRRATDRPGGDDIATGTGVGGSGGGVAATAAALRVCRPASPRSFLTYLRTILRCLEPAVVMILGWGCRRLAAAAAASADFTCRNLPRCRA
jgi:hypothetical protein